MRNISKKTAEQIYTKNIRVFKTHIKPAFRDTGKKGSVCLKAGPGFPEYPLVGVKNGHTLWTNEDLLMVFEPVVDRIVKLITHQINNVKERQVSLEVS
jgi:hypothetical protein